MSLRWLFIVVIVLWLIYEYTNKFWINQWHIDWKTIKIGIGCCLLLLLLALPSIEELVSNVNINAFLRKILINDSYGDVYTNQEPIHSEMLKKMHNGANIATL